MRTAIGAFACRLYKRTRGPQQDRQCNPMPATLAITGVGKSFFLDEMAALRLDLDMIFGDLEEMENIVLTLPNGADVVKVLPEVMREMKEILQNSVSLRLQSMILFEYK